MHEFPLAAQVGLACIEWTHDLYGADVTPLLTDAGIAAIRALAEQNGVEVLSICADYFMDRPLLRVSASELEERENDLYELMRRGRTLGIRRMVLPFVDASRIETDAELGSVAEVLRRAMPVAEETGVELHLETSLEPSRFAELLAMVPHTMLKVNYDSGNSASLGYHPREEFAAYGCRVGSVHIKDRVRGGSTVPLGTGNADFPALFAELKKIAYRGDFILQVARGAAGDEVNWARQNLSFVRQFLG